MNGEQMAAEMWAFRARSEVMASRRYARLAQRLPGTAFEPLKAEVERAAADEAEHAELCAGMAGRFGAKVSAGAESSPPEIGPRDLDPARRLGWELVAIGCFSESINAGLLLHTLDVAADPETRRVVRRLLADEVRHARIGWRSLGLADARWIGPFLPRILRATVHEELASPDQADGAGQTTTQRECDELGVLSVTTLRGVLRSSVYDVIVPGFEAGEIDTGELRDAAAGLLG